MYLTKGRRITLACLLFTLHAVAQPAPSASNSMGDKTDQPASTSTSPKEIRAANRALSKRVLKVLSRVKGLDATGIFVKASDGNIILSGVVQEPGQMQLAIDAARNVDGVKSVRNSLRQATQPTQ